MTMFPDGDVYGKLGIRPIINASGNNTVIGGTAMSQVVLDAMEEANKSFVDMEELLAKSGEYIAQTLGTEAAYVTSGTGAAMALSTAACMAGTNPEKILQLPDTTGMKNEIIFQKKQRYFFDRCFTLLGAKMVLVGDDMGCTSEQLESAIGPNTAAIVYYAESFEIPDKDSSVASLDMFMKRVKPGQDDLMVSLEDAVKLGRKHNVPVIVDAASQIYPLEYFRTTAQSADLVCFGAKYFHGPHSAGFVTGRKDLIEAVVANGFIAFHLYEQRASGRAMKLDRGDIVAAAVALDQWFSMNHEDRFAEYDRKFTVIQKSLQGLPNVRTRVVENNRFVKYHLEVDIDSKAIGKTAEQILQELYEGDPSVKLRDADGDDTLVLVTHLLEEGQENIVADRLRSVLTT